MSAINKQCCREIWFEYTCIAAVLADHVLLLLLLKEKI